MIGCAGLSADIAKLIYSLDPRDPLNVLLHLDHYFLSDNKSNDILQILGINDTDDDNDNYDFETIKSKFSFYHQQHQLPVSNLPNWWYSAAISLFFRLSLFLLLLIILLLMIIILILITALVLITKVIVSFALQY
jgi:hypothetical protein